MRSFLNFLFISLFITTLSLSSVHSNNRKNKNSSNLNIIVYDLDGNPLPDLEVRIVPHHDHDSDPPPKSIASETTNSSGQVLFKNLPAGLHEAQVFASDKMRANCIIRLIPEKTLTLELFIQSPSTEP